jgi:gamma-glutamylcyclotransferase (GGCT)/AIG2-like uncharacterized protein YtfP
MRQHIAATAPKPLPIRPVKRTLYFAYGSNLNEEQFFRRCPAARRYGPCTLPDYRLVFDGVADIIPARGAAVEGALYEITDKCECALDRYEGFPRLYIKTTFEIEVTNKTGVHRRKVMVYTMETDQIRPPSEGYVETIRQGFDDWGIPHATLDAAVKEALGKTRCWAPPKVKGAPRRERSARRTAQ